MSTQDYSAKRARSGDSPDSASSLMQLYDEDFVRAAYLYILGRPVDQAGLDLYRGHLRSGLSREECVVALANSFEAKQRPSVPVDLQSLITKVRKSSTGSVWWKPFRITNSTFEKEVYRRMNILENLLGALVSDKECREEQQQEPSSLSSQSPLTVSVNDGDRRPQEQPHLPVDLVERARRRLNHFSTR